MRGAARKLPLRGAGGGRNQWRPAMEEDKSRELSQRRIGGASKKEKAGRRWKEEKEEEREERGEKERGNGREGGERERGNENRRGYVLGAADTSGTNKFVRCVRTEPTIP
eukprot:768634-Hanusia_phi.AAC.1